MGIIVSFLFGVLLYISLTLFFYSIFSPLSNLERASSSLVALMFFLLHPVHAAAATWLSNHPVGDGALPVRDPDVCYPNHDDARIVERGKPGSFRVPTTGLPAGAGFLGPNGPVKCVVGEVDVAVVLLFVGTALDQAGRAVD